MSQGKAKSPLHQRSRRPKCLSVRFGLRERFSCSPQFLTHLGGTRFDLHVFWQLPVEFVDDDCLVVPLVVEIHRPRCLRKAPSGSAPWARSLWWVSTSVAALTVSVASLLVALPAELETTTLNCEPLSEVLVAAVVQLAALAPGGMVRVMAPAGRVWHAPAPQEDQRFEMDSLEGLFLRPRQVRYAPTLTSKIDSKARSNFITTPTAEKATLPLDRGSANTCLWSKEAVFVRTLELRRDCLRFLQRDALSLAVCQVGHVRRNRRAVSNID